MTDTAPTESSPLRIAIVTSTWNRRELLERLSESLLAQTDTSFTWVVVDDASTDDTATWLGKFTRRGVPFEVTVLRNESNLGKCASLNHAFDESAADFFLVVDSDDELMPNAVRDVRSKAEKYRCAADVGAVFFSYRFQHGALVGSSRTDGDIVLTRADHDARYGKYDGSVGYFRRVIERYRYPEFRGETYMGPTVLQLLMAPEFKIAFTGSLIGTAEYQPGGLTAQGRRLRLRNPRGMMVYNGLRSRQACRIRDAAMFAAMFHAYRILAADPAARIPPPDARCVGGPAGWLGRVAGPIVAKAWLRRERLIAQ